MSENPICKCQAIKAKITETGKGMYVVFLIKDKSSLPAEEFHDGLRDLKIGEVCNLYVTIEDIGL